MGGRCQVWGWDGQDNAAMCLLCGKTENSCAERVRELGKYFGFSLVGPDADPVRAANIILNLGMRAYSYPPDPGASTKERIQAASDLDRLRMIAVGMAKGGKSDL